MSATIIFFPTRRDAANAAARAALSFVEPAPAFRHTSPRFIHRDGQVWRGSGRTWFALNAMQVGYRIELLQDQMQWAIDQDDRDLFDTHHEALMQLLMARSEARQWLSLHSLPPRRSAPA